MAFCHKCGSRLPDSAAFCPACGLSIAENEIVQASTSEDTLAGKSYPQPTPKADATEAHTTSREISQMDERGTVKRKSGCLKWMLIIFGGIVALTLFAGIMDAVQRTVDPEGYAQRQAEREREREERERQEEVEARREQAEREAEERRVAAEQVAERRSGLHCLSAWDGSHRAVVRQVKSVLRNPDSFEHVETRIAPVNEQGNHQLVMQYRAENGFGGMNVEYASAVVNSGTCNATVTLGN